MATVLGIDYGEARLGLALGRNFLASPLVTLRATSEEETFAQIVRVCKDSGVSLIVLGLPLDREGRQGKMALKVLTFGKTLALRTGLKVEYHNETLSSQDAIHYMIESGRSQKDRREKLDAVAAAVILQEYLDQKEAKAKQKSK